MKKLMMAAALAAGMGAWVVAMFVNYLIGGPA